MESTYMSLASKSNFNKALRHFFKVTEVVDEIETSANLADIVNEGLEANEITEDQVLPIVGSVIRDKFNYSYRSCSLLQNVSEFQKISDETAKWTALDIVCVYYNPGGTIFLINPGNINHWEKVREIHNDQLMVIYAKFLKEENKKIELDAIRTLEEMLAGKDVFINKAFIDQTIVQKQPVKKEKKAEEVGKGATNITPKYAVEVSNELFHNGNVEAWKKIIESYTTSFPALKVYIFHGGELVNDINSLFKWGKVKHGDSIFFQVAGDNIKGVSKLQKYLYEGASPRFEQFLKIGVGQVLRLF